MTAFLSENIKVGSHFQFRDGFFRHELLRPMVRAVSTNVAPPRLLFGLPLDAGVDASKNPPFWTDATKIREEPGLRGTFVVRKASQFRDIIDGLSHTIAVGEIMTGRDDRDNRTTGFTNAKGGFVVVADNPKRCFDLGTYFDPARPTFWNSAAKILE